MRRTSSLRWLLPLLALLLMVAACGNSDDNGDATPTPDDATTTTPTEEITEEESTETEDPAETPTEDATPTDEEEEPTEDPDAERGYVPFEVEVLATDLDIPWEMVFLPDGRKLVTQRPGQLLLLDEDFNVAPEPIMEFDVVHERSGEAGLLGMVLHPEFEENNWIYIYHSYDDDGLRNRVVRFEFVEDELTNPTVILDDLPGAYTHNGGRLAFGPDDKLYVTIGDAQQQEFAQDPEFLAGKILRLNDDGSIPEDNPYEDSPAYAVGLRNPQGITWHPETGQMYTNQHGPSGNDEVNKMEPGHNYGWPDIEGYEGEVKDEFTLPVMASGTDTWAPSGSTFIEGDMFPQWQNRYLMAGLRSVTLYWIDFEQDEPDVNPIIQGEYGRFRTVIEGPDGYIYLLTSNRDKRREPAEDDDKILRLVPATE